MMGLTNNPSDDRPDVALGGAPSLRAALDSIRRAQAIEKLAEFFTGSEVGHQSIALAMPPHGMQRLRERADAFFALRQALGVHGYASKEEAITVINRVLEHV